MAEVLLIHGSCHGAWCWRDVIPALEASGHSARAITLPGHGDGRDPAGVTLAETAEVIAAASTPDTLVLGHSWGGFPISAAAEAAPENLRGLIYLCAYIPVNGMSLIGMRKAGPRQTLTGTAAKNQTGTGYTFLPETAPDLFYHDCPAEAVRFALQNLCLQPIRPQDTAIQLSERFESVPKAYIRCSGDRVIPPEYQAQMAAQLPPQRVYDMKTSHSPFFADPNGLADLIGQIAKDF
ncbi:alpha/beta fold hydrolase [Leisingera sp. HS039]|uniref:alpha/beta fold hydrolase n=1 Tax=unclassified Leisingera TaxID=2614906 RepID=UPI0010715AD0|nr:MULTISPECIES: alpha/beta fold hydrolase [unclassified Leisingera]MBQ4827407.1 alpha/beta fold hydrolase [Leisingera sp. HS039]QBR35239.1 alpha/beta fold hydrolase [Leisingera sp. NJS201]